MVNLEVLASANPDLIIVVNLYMTVNLNAFIECPITGALHPVNRLICCTFKCDAATVSSRICRRSNSTQLDVLVIHSDRR